MPWLLLRGWSTARWTRTHHVPDCLQADQANDQRLARHLTSLFYETIPEHARALIPLEELKEYVAFARTKVHPTIGDEAAPLLAQAYLDMRMMGQDPSGNVNRCEIAPKPAFSMYNCTHLTLVIGRLAIGYQEPVRMLKLACNARRSSALAGTW